jgi:hypothetical protein
VERSAGRAFVRARPGGCRDELALAAEVLDRLRSDEDRLRPVASGASDGVLPDGAGDARRAGRRLDAAAEKLADLERGDRAADGLRSAVLDAAEEAQGLYKPDAGLSAARSFADREPVMDAAAELELPAARFVRLELIAAHSRLAAELPEHSPPAVRHAGLPVLLEQ